MKDYESNLISVAQAEDTFDLLNHIAWTDVIKPKLDAQVKQWSAMLVNEALGLPIPSGHTREQVAGMCYGINYISTVFERVLKDGEKALADLHKHGITL